MNERINSLNKATIEYLDSVERHIEEYLQSEDGKENAKPYIQKFISEFYAARDEIKELIG